MSDSAFNLVNNPDTTRVPWTSVVNTYPMVSDQSTIATQALSLAGDTAAVSTAEAYTDSKIPKTYVNGTLKTSQRLRWVDSTTTSGGNATFYITSDRTSSGTARATAIDIDSVVPVTTDGTAQYAFGVATSPTVKSVVIPILKQAFSGISVVGINVLGSVTNSAAPDGTAVKVTLDGDAV